MEAKTKKIVIASSIIGAIAIVAGIMVIRSRNKKNTLEKTILATVDSPTIDDKPVGKLIEWPLKYGSGYLSDSERECVKTVQSYLNKKIIENNVNALPILTVDGHFGDSTQNALQKIAGVSQVSYTLHGTMESYVKAGTFGGFLDELFGVKPLEI